MTGRPGALVTGARRGIGRAIAVSLAEFCDAVALADPLTVVLAVLELAQLGRRRQLLHVPVSDVRRGERALESRGVRPEVVGSGDAAALAYIE